MGLDEKLALIYAGQPLPPPGTASVFLAGPTPRSADVRSWGPAALREIAAQWPGQAGSAHLAAEQAQVP